MENQYAGMKGKDVNGTRLDVGMPVVDKWGNFVGKVAEIYNSEILVDRSMNFHNPQHVYIPLSEGNMDKADQFRLNVTEEEVDLQGWRKSNKSD